MIFNPKYTYTDAVNAIRKALCCIITFFITGISIANAQTKNFTIDVSKVDKLDPVNLDKMGGTDPQGNRIAVNNYYITQNNIPIIPITGEFHYSRYPNQYWDESIKKIKAGGINLIATYVFWNIHEEKEGVFNWSGDRDLRKFIELCAKNDIKVVVRVGPFDHGEIRNGGLPDWLLSKPLIIRSNDPLYLHYVGLLYNEIGKQLKGLYYKDGGPVIAVQLENEMQHSASPWGLTYPGQPYDLTVADRDINSAHEGVSIAKGSNPYAEAGNEHMRNLKALAIKAGIIAPLYTATGWGYAAGIPQETLPVTAAYAYPTWTAKKELSPFYLYKDLHHHPDYSPVRYQPMDYPAFAAEIGSGIMSTYDRRPLVPAESVDAIINRCLGGGANGIGYYMYHGGSTLVGDHYFFNDEAYGYPKISYDFQAPIGEYGQIRPSFNRLKLLHFFINDFASVLAPMLTVLPENEADIKADNIQDLRYAVRSNGTSGFLFINNFQDDTITTDKQNFRISIQTKDGQINIPERGGLNINSGENVIMPFNFDLNGHQLIYSSAQLLTKGDDPNDPFYVFFTPPGVEAELCFSKANTTIKAMANGHVEQHDGKLYVKGVTAGTVSFNVNDKNGKTTHVLVISKAMALQCFQEQIGGSRHLVFSDALVLNDGKSFEILSKGENQFSVAVYPKIALKPEIDYGTITEDIHDKLFSRFEVVVDKFNLQPDTLFTGSKKMSVTIPTVLPKGLNDIFLNIDYVGDTGMGFLNGGLVTDEFYKGIPWEIGLKRFINKDNDPHFGFYFRPLMSNAPFLVDLPDSVADIAKKHHETLKINKVSYIPEYKSIISFK